MVGVLEIACGLAVLAIGVRLALIGWGIVSPPARAVARLGRWRATGTAAICAGVAVVDAGITRFTQAAGVERRVALWIFLLLGFGAVASVIWRVVEGSREIAGPAESR